jgi:L-amino acid N-acyltransferase YncA
MTKPDVTIREATTRDAEAICAIYNPHIRDTIVTFEEVEVPIPEMAARIAHVSSMFPWLVVRRADAVLGFAYASKWRDGSAYRHSVETTIYVEEAARGHGLGTELYFALLDRLRPMSLRTALGVVALPNAASVALHEKCGFKKVAHLSEVGFKLNRWIDVGYWQIVL